MSHFYGTIKGQRKEATRCGSKSSGLQTVAASWNGAIRVELYVDADGRDCFAVYETPWHGRGKSRAIAQGILGEQS